MVPQRIMSKNWDGFVAEFAQLDSQDVKAHKAAGAGGNGHDPYSCRAIELREGFDGCKPSFTPMECCASHLHEHPCYGEVAKGSFT
jgi:hypothetical protein